MVPSNYYQTLAALKQRINVARYKSLSVVNQELILMYLDIGQVLSEKSISGWGNSIVDTLSIDLQAEYPGVKGFSSRNLRRMRFIFEETREYEFWPPLVAKIPWGHSNVIFEKVKSKKPRAFYLKMSAERGWS